MKIKSVNNEILKIYLSKMLKIMNVHLKCPDRDSAMQMDPAWCRIKAAGYIRKINLKAYMSLTNKTCRIVTVSRNGSFLENDLPKQETF